MFNTSYKIATVWGIPIKIHISLILVMLFYALSVARGGVLAILATLLLTASVFFSVALHELGHSFVALRKGCRVREITLLFIGGAAMMEDMPRRPRDEIQMASAGPLVSIAVGLIGWSIGRQYANHLLGYILLQVGLINFFLAGFNLLPSFPMDGGRIFRAALTPKMGRLKATFVASRLGKIIAVFFGIYALLSDEPFAPRFILIAIAFLIFSMAENEYRMVAMQEGGRFRSAGRPSVFPPRPPPPFDPDVTYSEPDDDEVSVSPPPYKKGPGSRSRIRHEDDAGPFGRFFR